MRTSLVASAFLAAALAAACNPYDPDLGPEPFRCGTDEPRCPDGYTCVEISATSHLCQLSGTDIPDVDATPTIPDAGPFTCNDDSEIESNDTIDSATTTPIPGQSEEYRLVGLAICPTSDVDIFRFGVEETGKNVQANVTYTSGQGQLVLEILNSVGSTIATGNQETAALLRANLANAPQGIYFVRVAAETGAQNNYNIEIVTSGP